MDALLRAALALPVAGRAQLAAQLLASLEEGVATDREEVREAWVREIERRARRVRIGERLRRE